MLKLCILALLFYNIAVISSVPLENDMNAYTDQEDEMKLNLSELFKMFDEKNRENRREASDSSLENWTGRWMPDNPGDPTPPPKVSPTTQPTLSLLNHVPMGSNTPCDTGRANLDMDWDNSPVNYTCYGPKITPSFDIVPQLYMQHVPHAYTAEHRCMDLHIEYKEAIPL